MTDGGARRRSEKAAPRVSIGVPVYNGENFLAEALGSILAQTYRDFEIVICDNASTDRTEAICRDFAAADPRVRYYRNERNIGLGPNFNHVLELSRGPYFKWACHDDLLEPVYLEKCIAVLDAHPEIVQCHTKTRVIGEGDGLIADLTGLDAPQPSRRFAAVLLRRHWTMDIHGVFRAGVLRTAGPMPGYFGADKAVLAAVALLGPCARVPEPLFINRDHPARTMRAIPFRERLRFHDPSKTGSRTYPTWALYKDCFRAIRPLVPEPKERLNCYGHLAQWWFHNWNAARVGLDYAAMLAPSVSRMAYRAREHYHRGMIGTR